jgi:hypothetical protein
MFISHHQDAGQNHKLLIVYKSLENVAKLKHSGTVVTNKNCIQEETKSI